MIRGESYPLAGQLRILIDENKNIHWMGATSSGPEAIEDAVKPGIFRVLVAIRFPSLEKPINPDKNYPSSGLSK